MILPLPLVFPHLLVVYERFIFLATLSTIHLKCFKTTTGLKVSNLTKTSDTFQNQIQTNIYNVLATVGDSAFLIYKLKKMQVLD